MGDFIRHEPCGNCGSSDALARYDDGSAHCFSCHHNERADGTVIEQTTTSSWTPIQGYYAALTVRGITEETCRKCDYQRGSLADGAPVHIQLIKDQHGRMIDQKTRDKSKNFRWLGGSKYQGIIGSWSWPEKGKSVVITEGEIDRMSVSQAFDNKWATGSLPNGASSVKKALLADWDRLMRFETIVLCFDADAPGQAALQEACEVLPVGRVKVMGLPADVKDANEALLTHGPAAIARAYWDAKPYRPDGIVEGSAITKERIKAKRKMGYDLPWPDLNSKLMGLRKGEITMLTAGSGIGKSTFARHIAYHLQQKHGLKIGSVYLEESIETTAAAYVGLHLGVPLKNLLANPECISDQQWDSALADTLSDALLFDHFGSLEADRLINRLRYMAAAGCDFIILDHVSIVVSGLDTMDERRDIDVLMTKLRSFVQETGVGVVAIVHLKRKQGSSYNEGAQVSLSDFRGSAALEQLSDNAVAMERNQQDEKSKDTALLRVLKCRITGETGEADTLRWNKGRGAFDLATPFDVAEVDGDDDGLQF